VPENGSAAMISRTSTTDPRPPCDVDRPRRNHHARRARRASHAPAFSARSTIVGVTASPDQCGSSRLIWKLDRSNDWRWQCNHERVASFIRFKMPAPATGRVVELVATMVTTKALIQSGASTVAFIAEFALSSDQIWTNWISRVS
jgi:hypothetical protein